MKRFVWTLSLLAFLLALAPRAEAANGFVNCPFSGLGGDSLAHGVVVPNYPANNVHIVSLAFSADTAALYGLRLTLHRDSFDGPIVGHPVTEYLTLDAGPVAVIRTFDFGDAPVTPGDTLALVLEQVQGSGNVLFDAGTGGCSSGQAFGTAGTAPPLDHEDSGVGIQVAGDALLVECVASDTVACPVETAGQAFKVTVQYATSQGGGLSGDGQAIATSSLGVSSGAMFWFFNPANPEILVKVVNGCAVNKSYWFFAAADTNVGFTLTITNPLSGEHKTYTNLDGLAALPIQDTSALPCPKGGPS